MKYGIYIAQGVEDILRIGIINESEFNKTESKNSFLYLRWFSNSFDALAHKALLDNLSFKDLKSLIRKHNNSI